MRKKMLALARLISAADVIENAHDAELAGCRQRVPSTSVPKDATNLWAANDIDIIASPVVRFGNAIHAGSSRAIPMAIATVSGEVEAAIHGLTEFIAR